MLICPLFGHSLYGTLPSITSGASLGSLIYCPTRSTATILFSIIQLKKTNAANMVFKDIPYERERAANAEKDITYTIRIRKIKQHDVFKEFIQ